MGQQGGELSKGHRSTQVGAAMEATKARGGLVLFLIVVLLVGCDQRAAKPDLAKRSRAEPSSYFPRGSLGNESWPSSGARQFYSRLLYDLGEAPLIGAATSGQEAYRLIWAPSHQLPLIVRVSRGAAAANVVVRYQVLDPQSSEPKNGRPLRRPLTKEEWESVVRAIDDSDFWAMASALSSYNDASDWILEGVRAGRYHAVRIQSPSDGKFRVACVKLLRLAGVTLPEGEIY